MAGDALLGVPLERDELGDVLPAAVLERADREVEDLEREPAAQRDQPASERLVVAAPDADVGTARCTDFRCVLSGCGWKDGVRYRTVIRSAKNGSPTVGTGDEVAPGSAHDAEAAGDCFEHVLQALSSGHQNSSASALITQSAPKSVAASRAMRVTHSVWRRSSPGSRMRWSTPSDALALEDLRRAVDRPVVGGDDEVDAGAQMVRDLSVHDVGLVAHESVMTSLIADGD